MWHQHQHGSQLRSPVPHVVLCSLESHGMALQGSLPPPQKLWDTRAGCVHSLLFMVPSLLYRLTISEPWGWFSKLSLSANSHIYLIWIPGGKSNLKIPLHLSSITRIAEEAQMFKHSGFIFFQDLLLAVLWMFPLPCGKWATFIFRPSQNILVFLIIKIIQNKQHHLGSVLIKKVNLSLMSSWIYPAAYREYQG